MKNSWKGHIFSRPINGQLIPQRVQNLVIRNYVEKQGKLFALSACEYDFEHCFMMLKSVLKQADSLEAIVFYSLFMLPKSKEKRKELYDQLKEKNCELHFALEELWIKEQEDILLIEDILMVKECSQTCIQGAFFSSTSEFK